MRIRGTLKWSAGLGLGIFLLAALAWTAARLIPLSEQHRAAIAVLEQRPEHAGRNAFGLLWSLPNAVPEDRIEAILVDDARRIAELRTSPPDLEMYSERVEWARDDYPALDVSATDRALFCNEQDASCLTKVAEDPAAYRSLIARHAERLDRIESLADYGHLDQP